MSRLCLRAIAIMAAVAMVVTGILPGISAGSAWAQETPGVTLTAAGLDATHLVTALVDVSGKTQTEINQAVENAITGMTPIQVTLSNSSETEYSAVRIEPVNAGSNIQLWAKDTHNNWYDVNVAGWGPSEGFQLPSGYSVTTEVYFLADAAGTYPLTVTLVDVSNGNATLVEVSGTVTVRNPSVYDFVFDASGLVAGRPKTVPVTLKAVEVKDDGYSNVRVDVAVTQKPAADATVSLKATDTNGQEFDVVQVGYWGPENGFPISNDYNVTTDFTALFSAPGDYTIELTLYDVAEQKAIVSKSCSVTVGVPMAITAELPTFVVGQPAEFTVTTVANDDAGKLVRAYFTIPEGVSAEYYEIQDEKWYPLPNEYGPTNGFPVVDATSHFRATFDAAGTYTVGIDFKTVPDGEVLARYDLHAESRDPQKSAYEFFLDSDGLVAGRPSTVPVTFAAVEVKDEGYNAVRFNVAVTQKPSPDAAVSLKATDSDGQEFDVVEVGYWGPEAGFPIAKDYSATTEFKALFSDPGTYCLTLSLYDVTNQTDIMTREFEVQVEPVAATFAPTGNIGSHDGKVYEEYQLQACEQVIDLSADNVQSITVLKPGASEATALEPNTDSTLWFNVQNAAGDYAFTVVDKAGVTYTATLSWDGTTPATAALTYRTYEDRQDGNRYIEYYLRAGGESLDPSQDSEIYQVKPDGDVCQISRVAYNENFRVNAIQFQTTNQVPGAHTLLAKIGDTWYEASIVQTEWSISNLSTSGFTVNVSPAVEGLTTENIWIVLDTTGSPVVPITSLTTADGGANYTVQAALQAGQSYRVSMAKDGYAFKTNYEYNIAKVTVPTPPTPPSGGSGGSGGSGSTPAPQPVVSSTGSAAVNPAAGGKISLGEQVALQIPAGALSGTANVEVKIAQVANPPAVPTGYKVVGQVFEFTVANQSHYTFSAPVTLTFTFDPSLLKPGERPAVHYYDETNSRWVNIGGTVSGNTITVAVDHFTRFAVLAAQAAPTVTLTDIAGHWAEADIVRLVNLGAVGGYPDGTFRPNDKITRAEFVNILVKALKLEARTGKSFADTKGHWAEGAISTAAAWGIVDGYDVDHFGPNDPVTREQLVAMVVRALKLASLSGQLAFSDAKAISAWAKDAVTTAVAAGIIGGYPDGTFRPTATATRAEAATILAKALR